MKITAALPFKRIFSLADYSASDGWVITGKLSDADGSYELAAELFDGEGIAWTLSIPAETTTDYSAGDCTLYLLATLDGAAEVALELPCSIVELGTVSHARQMVTRLEAIAKELATKKYVTLSTSGGESITLDREGVEAQLRKYRKELAAEQSAAAGGSPVKTFKIGFGI